MADQVDIVVQVTGKFVVDAGDSAACVADEFPLRHFVFDVWTRQVDREHYQRETDDVDSICKQTTGKSNVSVYVLHFVLILYRVTRAERL